MIRFLRVFLMIVLIFVLIGGAGCATQAAKDQAAKTAAAHDIYASLITSTFNGTIAPADGSPVTAAELAATPVSVKLILANVIRSLYISRRGWWQANFALNGSPDPQTLSLEPPAIPGLMIAPIGTGN